MQPKQPIGSADAMRVELAAEATGQCAENDRFDQFARRMIARECKRREHRLARKADARDAILGSEIHQQIGDHRMSMKIQMAVEMIEAADQLQVKVDLCAAFVGEGRATAAAEEIT